MALFLSLPISDAQSAWRRALDASEVDEGYPVEANRQTAVHQDMFWPQLFPLQAKKEWSQHEQLLQIQSGLRGYSLKTVTSLNKKARLLKFHFPKR